MIIILVFISLPHQSHTPSYFQNIAHTLSDNIFYFGDGNYDDNSAISMIIIMTLIMTFIMIIMMMTITITIIRNKINDNYRTITP